MLAKRLPFGVTITFKTMNQELFDTKRYTQWTSKLGAESIEQESSNLQSVLQNRAVFSDLTIKIAEKKLKLLNKRP